MEVKKCGCKDWEENINLINAPWTLPLTIVGKYEGKEFEYCPWCGGKLWTTYKVEYGNCSSPKCTCGTSEFKKSTVGCPVHGIYEWGYKENY